MTYPRVHIRAIATARHRCAHQCRGRKSFDIRDKLLRISCSDVEYPMASLTCVVVPTACNSQSRPQCCKPSMQSAVLGLHPRQSALVRSRSSYSRRPTSWTLRRVSCSAGDFEEGELIKGIKAGDKLKVKESRVVYHAPKHKVGHCCMLLTVTCFSVS